jgi:ribosomal protein S18 acetylase RimI-like enzyme
MSSSATTGRARFRRLDARDRADRLAHLARLGREASRARFLAEGVPTSPPEPLLAVGCWLDGRLRGLAELYDLPGRPGRAELAASVEPPFQGRGLGTILLDRLLVLARNRGLRHLLTLCAEDNGRLIALLRRAGATITIEAGEARAELELLPATPATLALERLEQWGEILARAAALQRAWSSGSDGSRPPPLASSAGA